MTTLAQTMAAESDLVLRHQTFAPMTTVERVLAWLAPDQGTVTVPEAQQQIVKRTIVAVSGMVLNYMNRDTLARALRTENYPSSMTGRIVLRHWPVLSVSSVRSSPATAALASSRYSLEVQGSGAQRLVCLDGGLRADLGGVDVVYESGYVRTETVVVPSNGVVQASSILLDDEGVVQSNGTLVDAGAYTVSPTGTYTFTGLVGQTLTLVYSYVPEDIEQAVIEEVALAYRSRQRIGEQSKALPNAGGTVSYAPRALSQITKEALRNYVRVVPS